MTAILLPAASAGAMDMVAGGFGADPAAFFERPSLYLQRRVSFDADGVAGLDGFTPRSSGTLFVREIGGRDVALSLDVESDWLERMRQPQFVSHAARESSPGMLVGGALHLDDLGVMGGLGRGHLFGAATDMVAAGLDVGPLRARVAYGPGEPEETGVRDVMMFSTDLTARSWLTLQGDVAIGTEEDTGDHAMGRVGVKLRF